MKFLNLVIFTLLLLFVATPLFSESGDSVPTAEEMFPMPHTNSEATPKNVMAEIEDIKFAVGQWGNAINIIQKAGWSMGIAITLLLMLLYSTVALGTSANIILNGIEFLCKPPTIKRLDKLEKWIDDYLIKWPSTIIKFIRTKVKKK